MKSQQMAIPCLRPVKASDRNTRGGKRMHIGVSGVLEAKGRAKRDAPPLVLRLRGIMANRACGQEAPHQFALCNVRWQTVVGEIQPVIASDGNLRGLCGLGHRRQRCSWAERHRSGIGDLPQYRLPRLVVYMYLPCLLGFRLLVGAIAVGQGLAQAAGADPHTLSLWFDLGGATGIMPNETSHDMLL
jgi:hypothetical protein